LRVDANKKLAVSLAFAAAVTALPSVASAADLNLLPHWPQVAINIVAFGLLIYPVNKLMISPLLHLIEARQQRTEGSVDEAARLDAEGVELTARLEAQSLEARARAQARRAAIMSDTESQERALLTAASGDAAKTIESVRSAIDADLVAARAALQTEVRALANEAATRLLGRPL
jgi:F-type H+-transporting ATPase subunit b